MNDTINPNGYTVVYFDGDDYAPKICDHYDGVLVDGRGRAIFDTIDEAIETLKVWPTSTGRYGIIPTRMLVDEVTVPVTYTVKPNALATY